MNIKKLLILPLTVFLASCNSFFNPTFFGSSEQPSHYESSIQDPVDPTDLTEPSIGYSSAPYPYFYGSADMPLTVKDALGIINADVPTYGHTQYPLYVEGIIRYNDKTGYDSTRNNYLFYLCDESDYSSNFYVYRAINGSNVSEIAYENDRVVVSGYVTQYKGTPEMAVVDTTQAYVYEICSRGYSPITVNNIEHGVISEIPSNVRNGNEVSFVAIPDNGYRVEFVKINNVTIQPDNVTYRFIVKGDTNIEVKFIDNSTPEVNYGTAGEPLSVIEALAIAENECTGNGVYTNQPVYVTGAVKASTSPRLGNIFRFYLNDLTESSTSLYIYTCNAGSYSELHQGDLLVVCGYMKNYTDNVSGQVSMEMDSNPQTGLVPEIVSLTHNSSNNILDGEMNDVVWTDKVKQNYYLLSQEVNGQVATSIKVYANLNDDGLYIFIDYAVSEIKQGSQSEWWTWDNFEFRLANSLFLTWSGQYWMTVMNGGKFVSVGSNEKNESMFYKPLTLGGDGLYRGAFEGFVPYGDDMLIQGSDIYISMGANPVTGWICSPNFSGPGSVDTNSSQLVIRPGDGIIVINSFNCQNGHSFGDWLIDVPSTCMTNGSAHRICSVCGYIDYEMLDIDPYGHQFNTGDVTIIDVPTCSHTGTGYATCTICGLTESIDLPEDPTNHTDTDFLSGNHLYCHDCGSYLTQPVTFNHNEGGWRDKSTWADLGVLTGDFQFYIEVNMKGCQSVPDTSVSYCCWRTILPIFYEEGWDADDYTSKACVFRMDWYGWDEGGFTSSRNVGTIPEGFDWETCYEAFSDMDIELTVTKIGANITLDWVWKCNATSGYYYGKTFNYHQGCTLIDSSKVGVALTSEYTIFTINKLIFSV